MNPKRRFHRTGILIVLAVVIFLLFPARPAERTAPVEPFPHPIALSKDQSSCLACHRNVYDIAESAPQLADGRHLFTTLGCIDCHRMDSVAVYEKRKIGPDLRHVSDKLSPTFVAQWIADPAAFRPSTQMPRIFSAHNANLPQETAAITAYIFHNATPLADQQPLPSTLSPNYANGNHFFHTLGCLACHADPSNGSPATAHFGPDLSVVGRKLLTGRPRPDAQQWIFGWLKNPKSYNPNTLMPNLRLTDQEALDLSQYLLSPGGDSPAVAWSSNAAINSDPATLALGAKLILHYGCANCHEIGGPVQSQTALNLSNWGDKPLDKLDFSRLPADKHTRRDWLSLHLTDSEVPAANESIDMPRMPIFHLPPEKADAIATFVLGNRDWGVDPALAARALNPHAQALAKGRALTLLHNCIGCHKTETNTPLIQQYYAPSQISTFAPPPLRGEGVKVQTAWLKTFLAHPTPLRPLLAVRMPTFGLSQSDIDALADYFPAAAQQESRTLRRWISANRWNDLEHWAITSGQAAAIDLDPRFSTPAEIAATRHDIQFKAEFTANLYDETSPSPKPTDSHPSDNGQQFLQTLHCLDCHAMSPPQVPVDALHAKAPNLDLIAQRLQPRWVRAWIQEPDILQHGTNMPAYFTGLPIYNLDGQPIAAAMKLPSDQAARFADFGRTVTQQTRLLIDFLYDAAAKQETVIHQP